MDAAGSIEGADPAARRLRTGAPFCIVVFLALRIALSVLSVAVVHSSTPVSGGGGAPGTGAEAPAAPGWHNAYDGTDRFDAAWFLEISQHGYREDDASAAFLPGYPLAIRAVSWLVGNQLTAALLVSNGAFLLALIVLHALTAEEYDVATARRAVVITAAFPTSFFLLAPYSESSFLLLTLLAFRSAAGRRWAAAGIAGAAAAATRAVGIALIPALAVEAWQRRTRGGAARGFVAAASVLVGPILYLAYWSSRGDMRAPIDAQAAWDRRLTFPLTALGRGLTLGVRGIDDPIGRFWSADLLVAALAVIPLAIGWRRLRAPYSVYAAASLLLPLSYPLAARPLLSFPRFVAVVFPVSWVWATFLSTRVRMVVAVGLSAIAWCALATWFVNWRPFF
jgi:Mannosyltransferase (PIG-V)